MAIYLEIPNLNKKFPFRTLFNEGNILTTPHWHKELELIYVESGVIHMGFDKEAFDVSEGEFVFVAGGKVHYVLASPGSIRYVYQFDEKLFDDVTPDKQKLKAFRALCRDYPAYSGDWDPETAASTAALLKAIYREDQERGQAYEYAIKGHLCMMILGMFRNQEACRKVANKEFLVESNLTIERLDTLFRYVEDHYTEPITLADVSDQLGLSSYYFTKFFKANVGKTFIEFLNEYRVEKAKWILLNEDRSPEEVAYEVGIGSTKTYYRLFKQIVGMTPREYKLKYRIQHE